MRHPTTVPPSAALADHALERDPLLPAGGRQRRPTAESEAKRERILLAAQALFHAQGYAHTTMAQIVGALGVTKPFVYYYFRNK